ncbi:CPBP family intramembrane metalloprotease, partial [Halomonas sp. ND22Bw]
TKWRFRTTDVLHGAGLAALVGVPGLLFYITAVHLGLSKHVEPSGLEDTAWRLPLLVFNSWANGFAEEIIVVAWLATRLRQLRVSWPWIFV